MRERSFSVMSRRPSPSIASLVKSYWGGMIGGRWGGNGDDEIFG